MVGGLPLGGSMPIRLQSMTTTNTNSTQATVEQSIRIINAGGHYVRITAQGVKEASNLRAIKESLRSCGYENPLIADIHFNPSAAIEAAKHVEKIRINPGNYSDKRSLNQGFEYADDEYAQELARAEERILPLLSICKERNVAIRVGVNHGSLSDRIMSRYGDTPMGMAQSALEFLHICAKHNFHSLVVSMKSSNTRVMVQSTRTLVMLMDEAGMNYPLHLGVTEAGEGEDGRIKSAVGIATLLADGIGDTIRVSLTEEPELEIPVAKSLVDHFQRHINLPEPAVQVVDYIDPTRFERRSTIAIESIGGDNFPVVVADLTQTDSLTLPSIEQWGWKFCSNTNRWQRDDDAADFILAGENSVDSIPHPEGLPLIGCNKKCRFALVNIKNLNQGEINPISFALVDADELNNKIIESISAQKRVIPIIKSHGIKSFYSIRWALHRLKESQTKLPAIVSFSYPDITPDDFTVSAAADLGPMFVDGLCNGMMISGSSNISPLRIRKVAFGILQAARERITKTEFISCPGCGRTLFNLNETLKRVKEKTAHLKGLKIGVMGCIVNGPGEMADADYGYVGAGAGRVTLYRRKEVVKKNVPEERAVDELIDLIKENGDWA